MDTTWFDAPTLGEAPSLTPDQLGPQQARRLRNFLVHKPGQIVPRGGLGGTATTEIGSLVDTTNGGTMLMAATSDDYVGVTYRAPSATPLVDNWRVPINKPTVAGDLAQPSLGATALRVLNVNTGVVTDVAVAAATSITGPSVCRVDDALYTATFGGVSTAVATGVAPLNCVRKAVIGGSAVVLTNGPRFVQAVFSHAGRLWAAAARGPALADYDTSQIFYTIPGGTTAFTDVATDWRDPVNGDLNRFSIGAKNDGDFVVGFGRDKYGHLLVFKRNAVYVLYGTAPSNFTLRQLRGTSGCVDLRSIVVAEEGTYFASQLGYELFDGDRFRLLSRPIADTWLPVSNAGVASGSVNHAYIKAQALPNEYLYVSLGTDGVTANSDDGTTLGWLMHRPTGAWIDLRTAITSMKLGASGYLNSFAVTQSHMVAFGAAKWALADKMTYGMDATNGLLDRDAAAAFNVDLLWQTRLDNLVTRRQGGRWVTSTLQHLTADYATNYINNTPADLDAWGTVLATDGYGASLSGFSAKSLPGYKLSTSPTRVRPMFNTNHELDRGDVCYTLQSTIGSSSSLRLARLAIYGLGVGFNDEGRERHVA